MQKNFAEWRNASAPMTWIWKMTDPLKEELLSGLQGQELASQGNQQLKEQPPEERAVANMVGFLKALEKELGVSLGKPWGPNV